MVDNPNSEEKVQSLAEFLQSSSQGEIVKVQAKTSHSGAFGTQLQVPEIILICHNDTCNGERFFLPSQEWIQIIGLDLNLLFLEYSCKNCNKTHKTYAIGFSPIDKFTADVVKFGEMPQYDFSIPARLIALIGPDRDLFIKGKSCEIRGQGIGAFAYYRRVIENQKNRIIDEIIKVCESIAPTETELLKELRAAKSETQFVNSVDAIKHGLPERLLVQGQNPLKLLHSALSDGMHDRSDEECLERAGDIRTILIALVENIKFLSEEKKELGEAVSRLLKKKSEKGKKT